MSLKEKVGPDDATHVACTVEMTPLSGHGMLEL